MLAGRSLTGLRLTRSANQINNDRAAGEPERSRMPSRKARMPASPFARYRLGTRAGECAVEALKFLGTRLRTDVSVSGR